MNQRTCYILRLVISLLLVTSSFQVASWSGRYPTELPATELLSTDVIANEMDAAITERQVQFKSSEDFFQNALIISPPLTKPIRPSASFLFQAKHRLAQSLDQKTITIRAPPAVKL